MSEIKISTFISRCLTYGIRLYPFQQQKILQASERFKVPDKELELFDNDKMVKYVNALDWSTREDSKDWSLGHEKLKELGFEEQTRVEGHRHFVTMAWSTPKHSTNEP